MNSNRDKYKSLCDLYCKYRQLVQFISEKANEDIANIKVCELDNIVQKVEDFPIPYSFYKKQSIKFVPDFENLVIFYGG